MTTGEVIEVIQFISSAFVLFGVLGCWCAYMDLRRLVDPEKRARKLLLEKLTEGQRREFMQKNSFTVKTARDEYELRTGITIRKSDGQKLCASMPGANFPVADQMLARKLLLETDEAEFLRVANRVGPGTGLGARYNIPDGWSPDSDMMDYCRMYARHVFENVGYDMRDLIFTVEPVLSMHYYVFTARYRGVEYQRSITLEHLVGGQEVVTFTIDMIDTIREQMTRAIIQNFAKRDLARRTDQVTAFTI